MQRNLTRARARKKIIIGSGIALVAMIVAIGVGIDIMRGTCCQKFVSITDTFTTVTAGNVTTTDSVTNITADNVTTDVIDSIDKKVPIRLKIEIQRG